MLETIAPGVIEIDTMLGGWAKTTAGYLLDGDMPVLIETGSQSSVPVLLDALREAGLGANDLAGVALTHIHLDHAGGVGDVARAFPKAMIYVHELGARHLVDPSRLIASAEQVYGSLLDELYGRIEPSPKERIRVLYDNDLVDLGASRTLLAIDSPGHAKHHLGFLDSLSGVLFSGDAVGVRLPGGGVLRPATPPPDFDLDLALGSLKRFGLLSPARIALAHYGLLPEPPDEILESARDRLNAWTNEALRAYREGIDIGDALNARFAEDFSDLDKVTKNRLETLNGVHANAAGIRRWIKAKDAATKSTPSAS
jgi:glyoxylase-like metal-dependent hydrolase (beta-lactamase superfamily II)